MGYIGRGPVKSGAFRIIDDVSSGFDGSDVTFTLQHNSSNITPGTEQNLLIAVDGVVQEPQSAFTISGSTLTFTSAPASGASFWGIELGDVGGIAQTIANGTVDTSQLVADAVTNAELANMAANTVKVNATTGSANPTDISMASANLSGAIADGDVLLIYDASTTSLKTVAKSVLVAGIGGDLSFGGDTFGANKTIGSNDNYSLTFETYNTARIVIANYGQITMPTQPAFCGYLPSNVTNVTGQAGTAWTMTGLTEDFDRGKAADNSAGNFNGSTFTAPVAGVYYFHSQAYMAGWAATSVIAPSVWLYKGSSAMFQGGTVDTAGDMVSSGRVRVDGMMLLAAGDTVTARVTATNASGGNIVDIQGGNNPRYTWFMGYLVA